MSKTLECPICKREVVEPDQASPRGHFPFCSERCKLIDLGRWLGGKYQIASDTDDESDDEFDVVKR
jgi:uncharacterized protein